MIILLKAIASSPEKYFLGKRLKVAWERGYIGRILILLLMIVSLIFSGRCIKTLSGHEARLNDVHSDPVRIVSVAEDPVIRVWDFHPHNTFN